MMLLLQMTNYFAVFGVSLLKHVSVLLQKSKIGFMTVFLLKDLISSIAELLPLPDIWSNAVVSDEKYFGQQTTNIFFT